MEDAEFFMGEALALAGNTRATGDVPVGCVVVCEGKIIGRGWNTREKSGSATGHAEVMAIEAACAARGGWRLTDAALYVTLEPCPMCAGAIISARVGSVYYGAKDEKAGACGSVLNLFEEKFNHKPKLYGGIRAEECRAQLQDFFAQLRKKQ